MIEVYVDKFKVIDFSIIVFENDYIKFDWIVKIIWINLLIWK